MFGLGPSTSTLVVLLAEIPNEVQADSKLFGMSGVLTSVATHYPELDFEATCRGYTDGWSDEEIHVLGKSLMSPTRLVAEQVTLQWVMEAPRLRAVGTVRQDTII